MKLKVALVGLGGMGKNHFRIYSKFDDIDFVAACDIREERIKIAKEIKSDMNFYTDYAEMLEKEKPDIVDVSTPTFLHAEQAIAALRAGAHVICEKPMALNSNETASIIAEAKKAGKEFMSAHVVRFMKAYAYLADTIHSGKYGKLLKLDLRRVGGTPLWSWENWFLDKERSGHTILDLVIHDIDFMQSVLGQPKDILGAHYEFNNNTNYASLVYLYDGCSVSIDGGWFKGDPKFEATFMAFFENGYLKLSDKKLIDNHEEIVFGEEDVIQSTGINITAADGYTAECRYFIDCIKDGKTPDFVTPESSAATIALVEKTIEKAVKIS